jgi:hypothetical protein
MRITATSPSSVVVPERSPEELQRLGVEFFWNLASRFLDKSYQAKIYRADSSLELPRDFLPPHDPVSSTCVKSL